MRSPKRCALGLGGLFLLIHAAVCLPQASGFKSDWEEKEDERNWREDDGKQVQAKLPSYPKDQDLLEFFVSETNTFRFFLDSTSISIGPDGVVRFTLVARSPGGTSNVSYEGIRCKTAEHRAYAFGRADGSWSVRPTAWQRIQRKSVQRWHESLRDDYLCKVNAPALTVGEILRGLRSGNGLRREGR